MKKFLIVLFSTLFLLGFAACSNEDQDIQQDIDQANKNNNTNIESVEENNDNTDQSTDDSDENSNSNSENHSDETDTLDEKERTSDEKEHPSDEIADFEESQELKANISQLDKLKPEIKNDNSNKRVIFFVDDNNHKQFKSIYIKQKNHLKIIELNKDDGLLFNDKI